MVYPLLGDFYIVVKKKNWNSLSGRLTSGTPKALAAGEVAIKLAISVPESLFKAPQFQAKVTIPEGVLPAPVIDASVIDNVREIIAQQTGMKIELSMVQPEENE